jgi:transcriptional regulator with XRE-family HTH domain
MSLSTFRDRVHITQAELAEHLGVTRHYYIRLEQGLYHEIPDGILAELAKWFGVTEAEISGTYRTFQKVTREQFRESHLSFKKVLLKYNGLSHPLTYYREHERLTRMGLCKGLCLHYDGVTQYEANKQRGVPLDIRIACNDIYWDYTYLETAVAEWRISGRADRAAKKLA